MYTYITERYTVLDFWCALLTCNSQLLTTLIFQVCNRAWNRGYFHPNSRGDLSHVTSASSTLEYPGGKSMRFKLGQPWAVTEKWWWDLLHLSRSVLEKHVDAMRKKNVLAKCLTALFFCSKTPFTFWDDPWTRRAQKAKTSQNIGEFCLVNGRNRWRRHLYFA